MYVVNGYLAYLAISLTVTVWVAWTLSRNGKVFLVDALGGDEKLAGAVNHLLVVGFCLINTGFVATALQSNGNSDTMRGAVEMVAGKTGFALLVLGVMHFFNLYVFTRIRGRARAAQEPPPIPPDGFANSGSR